MIKNHKDNMTFRGIKTASIRCAMCGGHGWSMWEPVCSACSGKGVVAELIYSDCGCSVESNGDPDCESCYPVETETIDVAA